MEFKTKEILEYPLTDDFYIEVEKKNTAIGVFAEFTLLRQSYSHRLDMFGIPLDSIEEYGIVHFLEQGYDYIEYYLREIEELELFSEYQIDRTYDNGTTCDFYHRAVLNNVLKRGTLDENPRPHYEDEVQIVNKEKKKVLDNLGRHIELKDNQWLIERNGKGYLCTPAHTLSVNHTIQKYDLSKGEYPLETLRPIAWKSAIKEILWIYQMQSNKLSDLHKMGIKYWNEWDIGDGTIGCRYGATVKRWNLMNKLLDGLKKDPFGRRHIINLWQEADFHDESGGTDKGLNPCCYETIWNVRRASDGELYLDMLMNQRSSDYEVSSCINELQYVAFMMMVAHECGFKLGVFTHVMENVQIYDRHIEQAKEILNREPIKCKPKLVLNAKNKSFYDITIDDFRLENYPLGTIKVKNPQLKFDLGI